MEDRIAISVEQVSKKFCRNLRRSMVYGLIDIMRAMTIPGRFRSENWESRRSDREASEKSGGLGLPETPFLRKDEFWALRDVSFRVAAGERVGLLGLNGAGKSTLFSILSRIYAPTCGVVRIKGRLQALIALGAGFHPNLSGRENIYINAAILGMKGREIDTKIDEIIDFAEVREAIEAPIRTYSSGMLVRLGFAVAAQLNPDILLLDEVLSVGDGSFQAKSLKKAAELTQRGCTVILVSHNLLRIQAFSERCLWLDRGRICADGPTPSVLPEYDNFLATRLSRSRAGHVASLRRGSGLVGIESYELMGEDGQPLSAGGNDTLPEIRQGNNLRVRLSYVVNDGHCGHLRFHIGIKEPSSGLSVTEARSEGLKHLCTKDHRGVVEVVFPKLGLLEGDYCLYLAIGDDWLNGSEAHAVIDEIASSFRVIATGESFRSPQGKTRGSLVELPYKYTVLS